MERKLSKVLLECNSCGCDEETEYELALHGCGVCGSFKINIIHVGEEDE